jgi:hypothetical protein
MTQDPELDPCPFCGGPSVFSEAMTVGRSWKARCDNQNCPVRPFQLESYRTKAEAAAVWNYRPDKKAKEVK